MKRIHAEWEKRNLGIDCDEITLEPGDSFNDVSSAVGRTSPQYIVLKVPTNMPEYIYQLPSLGFVFAETMIQMVHDLKNTELDGIWARLNRDIDYTLMDESDERRLYEEIKNGLFNTDRIFLDPFFSGALAATRYINWIKDEKSRGSELYKIYLKDKTVGFFTLKNKGDGVYFPFLAGLYSDMKNSGLGFSINYKVLEEVKKRNGKMVDGYISSNNPAIIKIQNALGYSIKQIYYVYVRHPKASKTPLAGI